MPNNATEIWRFTGNGFIKLQDGSTIGPANIVSDTVAGSVSIPTPTVQNLFLSVSPLTVAPPKVVIPNPAKSAGAKRVAPTISRSVVIPTPSVSGGQPLSNMFVGAPTKGKFYVALADGSTTVNHTGGPTTDHSAISYGQFVFSNKMSVRHGYSTDTNARPSATIMDEAINAGLITSQSFKLNCAGRESAGGDEILAGARDADLDVAISRCQTRAPWPVWLSFYHEPGGDWNTTALRTKFRACYRYIVQYFRDHGNPSNVCFQPILEAPYDFRPSSYSPGGGRNIDWRELCPDWKGTSTRTIADWYTGSERMMDAFGLDIYNPLVSPNATGSFQDYSNIWTSVLNEFTADAFPYQDYAFNIMEMGWSSAAIDPDPNWNTYLVEVMTAQQQFNVCTYTLWDINNANGGTGPPRYCPTTPASDPGGTLLQAYRSMAANANCVVWPGV